MVMQQNSCQKKQVKYICITELSLESTDVVDRSWGEDLHLHNFLQYSF